MCFLKKLILMDFLIKGSKKKVRPPSKVALVNLPSSFLRALVPQNKLIELNPDERRLVIKLHIQFNIRNILMTLEQMARFKDSAEMSSIHCQDWTRNFITNVRLLNQNRTGFNLVTKYERFIVTLFQKLTGFGVYMVFEKYGAFRYIFNVSINIRIIW